MPSFDTPDNAIRALHQMIDYKRNQEMLLETPDSLPSDFYPDTTKAKQVVLEALQSGRTHLDDFEAQEVLTAYGIPVVETRVAVSGWEAAEAARELGFPVALKIRSPQIAQPFEFGGVALDLATAEQVLVAAASMVARVHKLAPDAFIEGFTVQRMGRRPNARELFIGVVSHPAFGPVIRFGHGGMAMRVIKDTADALPPLNMSLAKELIRRTRISRLLSSGPDHKGADIDDLCMCLIQVSQMIVDLPQITEMTINPLFADDQGVLALGARITVQETSLVGPERLAIRPYPRELEECAVLKDGTRVLIRPVRPEDASAHFDFVSRLSAEDLRLRFFGFVRQFDRMDMANFTQIDYDREMAFIATATNEQGVSETLGVVRAHTKPDNTSAEFSIVIRTDLKGKGLGGRLFDKMIRYCRSRGTRVLEGETLTENKGMIGLAQRYGFTTKSDYEDGLVRMSLALNPA